MFMEDGIIVAVLVVILFVGIRSTVKHFGRKTGCCGSVDYKPKKKKLSKVLYKKTFQVEGMHCEHCKRRVEEAVNDISGVAGVVNLKKNELVVAYETVVDNKIIIAKLEQKGYGVIEKH